MAPHLTSFLALNTLTPTASPTLPSCPHPQPPKILQPHYPQSHPNQISHFNTFSTQKAKCQKKKKAKFSLINHHSEHVTLLLKTPWGLPFTTDRTKTPHSGPGAPADWPLPPWLLMRPQLELPSSLSLVPGLSPLSFCTLGLECSSWLAVGPRTPQT